MLSGTDFVDNVDSGVRAAEQEAQVAQREVEALAQRRDAARKAQAEALRDLARVRLAALADGGAALGRLDAAEERLRGLFAARREELRQSEAALAEQRAALETAQGARDDAAAALRRVQAEEEAALDRVRERAPHDPELQRKRDAAAEATRIAAHAAEKAQLAHGDLDGKGKPYRADPLFAYLWDRGYGTSRYRAFPLVRLLDGWVARVANYEPARRNFALLSELPGRLDAHAARMEALAEDATAELRAVVRRLAGLDAAGEHIAAAEAAMEAADQRLEAARSAVDEAEAARAALAGGQDKVLGDAEAQLEVAFGAQDLGALREAARRTPSPEDDAIVARLEGVAAARAETERALQAAQRSAEAARRRLTEARALRGEMVRRGYGRSRWDFKDGALIGILISEVLRGALSRDGFWDRMGQHRAPGPWGQDRSSGPWGGPGGGWGREDPLDVPGPWRMPGPWGGGGGIGGGMGGGGFRTGGRMGGGGFKTGGSF